VGLFVEVRLIRPQKKTTATPLCTHDMDNASPSNTDDQDGLGIEGVKARVDALTREVASLKADLDGQKKILSQVLGQVASERPGGEKTEHVEAANRAKNAQSICGYLLSAKLFG
jgi:hypothetical protein